MTLPAETLRKLFDAGVDAVAGETATVRALSKLDTAGSVHLVAIGKAADAMARGALQVLGDRLVSALVITKHDHLSEALKNDTRVHCLEAGHPTPDQASLLAGQTLINTVSNLRDTDHLLFLVSGGASALVEDLIDGCTLRDLQSLTDHLLAQGYAIGDINRVRQRISRIKGGRLANFLPGCRVTQLLISDVPGDRPGDIGSGPLIAPAKNAPSAHLLAEDQRLLTSVIDAQTLAAGIQAPLPTASVWARIETHLIASSTIAQAGSLDGDVVEVAERIVQVLLAVDAPQGVYIWGGEPTVVLPESPGRGGRNQHLALMLAQRLQQVPDVWALCCGTDGTDGPTTDAGGLVSAETLRVGQSLNLDASASLGGADAGNYLQQTNSLVTTGPTGTNVMDLVVALRM